jgi:hypothetical protein
MRSYVDSVKLSLNEIENMHEVQEIKTVVRGHAALLLSFYRIDNRVIYELIIIIPGTILLIH